MTMSTLIPVHPSITEMSESDCERLYLDDEPRWVGPSAPTTRYVEGLRYFAEREAQRLADFIVDGDPSDDYTLQARRENYARARAELRRVEALDKHLYARDAEGFAGWIVRS